MKNIINQFKQLDVSLKETIIKQFVVLLLIILFNSYLIYQMLT
jgi:hypothetical protein